MTQEEKELLIKDLCARLPYSTDILTEDDDKGHIIGVDDVENGVFEIHIIEDGDSYTCYESIEKFKPYLRPMSSMTEEERIKYESLYDCIDEGLIKVFDWLNANHFDYRGLIEKGLALEATKDMYKNL